MCGCMHPQVCLSVLYLCVYIHLLSLPYLVQVVPECPKCREELTKAALEDPESEEEEVFAVMKPDIVFFGEQLPEEFHEWLQEDLSQVSSGSIPSSDTVPAKWAHG